MKTILCVVFLWILVMLFCSPAFMAHGLTIKVAEHVISFVLKLGSSQANRTSGNCAYLDGQTIPLINVGKWNRVTYQVRKLAGYILLQTSYITLIIVFIVFFLSFLQISFFIFGYFLPLVFIIILYSIMIYKLFSKVFQYIHIREFQNYHF